MKKRGKAEGQKGRHALTTKAAKPTKATKRRRCRSFHLLEPRKECVAISPHASPVL